MPSKSIGYKGLFKQKLLISLNCSYCVYNVHQTFPKRFKGVFDTFVETYLLFTFSTLWHSYIYFWVKLCIILYKGLRL